LPTDVGVNHLGVLWPGSDMEFPGGWVRPHPGPFVWGHIEPTPGVLDWREADLAVEKLQERRWGILATLWPFAPWDQAGCHATDARARGAFREFGSLLYAPCDIDAYLAWLAATVERYDGDGIDDMPGLAYPIRHWEILNEPEMQGPQLCFFQEDSASYAELLRQSYQAIKTADPSAIVLPAGQSGMHREAINYWRPMLQDLGIPFDVGNIHSIRCSNIQQDAAFWAPEYVDLLTRSGRDSEGFWITEAQTGSIDRDRRSGDDENARDLFIGTIAAFAEGADIILHVLANDPKGDKGELSLGTFNLLGRMIGKFASVSRIGASSVAFELLDGRAVYALWDDARLPTGIAGMVHVTTYLGETSTETAGLVLAHVPMLVEIP